MFMQKSQEKKHRWTMTVIFMLVMAMIIIVIPFAKDCVVKLIDLADDKYQWPVVLNAEH